MDVAGVISTVGVVGAGVIGRGVAQALAQSGHRVVLVDVGATQLSEARRSIERGVRTHHLVAGLPEALDRAAVMGRIEFTTDLARTATAEVIIENSTEQWAVKEPIYRALDRIAQPGCVLAANTSVIPIRRFADATTRPEDVVGLHFMNPVPLKPVVEAIRAPLTSDRSVAVIERLLGQMGMRAIWVNDSPGFVSNRVLMLTVNEAAALLDENVASARDVDAIFQGCFGHPMGPLATADLIGLDTIVHSLEGLLEATGMDKFEPSVVLRELVAEGHLGRKSGRGFHTYTGGGP